MSNVNDGGPAFPMDAGARHSLAAARTGGTDSSNEAAYIAEYARLSTCLSVRDYFAAKAMQGAMGLLVTWGDAQPPSVADAVSHFAYRMADAMLAARSAP